MKLRGIIFDFDGLLLDTERVEFETWQELYREEGVELVFEVWAVGVGAWDAIDLPADLERLTGRPVDRARMKEKFKFRSRGMLAGMDLIPGGRERVAEAQALGLKLAIASSSRRDWVEGHLKSRGLLDPFQMLACGSDQLRAKPAPDVYLAALAALELDPGEAVALEDSPNGIAAAKAAGIYCVAVPNAVTRTLDLSRADARADNLSSVSFAELQTVFNRIEVKA